MYGVNFLLEFSFLVLAIVLFKTSYFKTLYSLYKTIINANIESENKLG